MDHFDRVKVLIYEDFFQNVKDSLNSVLDFLGVEPVSSEHGLRKINISGRPKNWASEAALDLIYKPNALKSLLKPFLPRRSRRALKYRAKQKLLRPARMPRDMRRRLREEYQGEVEELERLLGRSLSHWCQADGECGKARYYDDMSGLLFRRPFL